MTQDNMISEMEPGMKTNTIKAMDEATAVMMRYFSAVVPDVSDNDFVDRVACGFDVGARPARAMPVMRGGLSAARDPLRLHMLEATGGGPMSSSPSNMPGMNPAGPQCAGTVPAAASGSTGCR